MKFTKLMAFTTLLVPFFTLADLPSNIKTAGELAEWIKSLSDSEVTQFNNVSLNPRLSPSIGTVSDGMVIEQAMSAGRVVSFIYTAPDFSPNPENMLVAEQRIEAGFCEIPLWLGLMGGGYKMIFDYRDTSTFARKFKVELNIQKCSNYLSNKK